MPRLSPAEKFELAAIAVVTALVRWLAPRAGVRFELGELIAGAALLILVQGFFRDLWLLREAKRKAPATTRAAACMCVESVMGLTGIVAGIALVGFGLDYTLGFSALGLTIDVGAVMLAGFLLKDFVFSWRPWRIYREKDHAQVIFRWGN